MQAYVRKSTSTIALVNAALADVEVDVEGNPIVCIAERNYFGESSHYYCNPVTCPAAAIEEMYFESLYANDVECETCGGYCRY